MHAGCVGHRGHASQARAAAARADARRGGGCEGAGRGRGGGDDDGEGGAAEGDGLAHAVAHVAARRLPRLAAAHVGLGAVEAGGAVGPQRADGLAGARVIGEAEGADIGGVAAAELRGGAKGVGAAVQVGALIVLAPGVTAALLIGSAPPPTGRLAPSRNGAAVADGAVEPRRGARGGAGSAERRRGGGAEEEEGQQPGGRHLCVRTRRVREEGSQRTRSGPSVHSEKEEKRKGSGARKAGGEGDGA